MFPDSYALVAIERIKGISFSLTSISVSALMLTYWSIFAHDQRIGLRVSLKASPFTIPASHTPRLPEAGE
jgi:hypothetical protein